MAHNPTEPVSQKGNSLLARLLQDKIIVSDSYSVPDNTPYYDGANRLYSAIIINNPTTDHLKLFDAQSCDSAYVTDWFFMEDGRDHYQNWTTFKNWISESMSHTQYITQQGVEALTDIICYMEKV